jgi:hypothetical protein
MKTLPRLVLSTVVVFATAISAFAQTHTWSQPGPGNWSVPANWSGGGVPNDPAHWAAIAYNSASPYLVTLNMNATLDRLDLVGNNAVLFSQGRTLSVLNNAAIGIPMGAGNTQILRFANSTFDGGGQLTNASTIEAWGTNHIENLYNDGSLLMQGNSAYGTSSLTLYDPAYNEGTIVFTSNDGGYASTLVTAGSTQLDNAGTLEFATGTGGVRTYNGSLLNRGIVNIGQPTNFNTGPFIQDQNKIHILGGGSLTVGTGVLFQMDGGALEVDGSMLQSSGTFRWNGGQILNNPPKLAAMALEIDFSNLDSGSLRMAGNSTVDGILRSGQVLYLIGDSAYGTATANWLGSGNLVHQGQVWMSAEDGGYASQIVIPSGSSLLNQGSIATQVGTGGARNINGHLVNDTSGSINFAAPTTLNIGPIENRGTWFVVDSAAMTLSNNVDFTLTSGTVDVSDGSFFHPNGSASFQGGGFVGIPRFANNNLTFGGAFSSAFEADVAGNSTMSGNLAAAQKLNLLGDSSFGTATLSLLHPNTTNAGEIYLGATDGGYSATLQTSGNNLLNTGLIQFDTGTGGTRTLSAEFTNEGMVQVNQPLTVGSGSYTNRGDWNVATGASVKFNNALVFTQESGTLQVDGIWEHPNGTVILAGGTVNGEPLFSSTNIMTDPAFTSPFTGRVRGTNTLTGDLQSGQKITLQGDSTYGGATMNLVGGNVNDGEIELMTSDGGFTVRLGTTDAILMNSGTVRTIVGAGGLRFLRGDISNSGTIEIDATTTLEDGPILNSGTISIAPTRLLKLSNGMTLEQSAGNLQVDGSFEHQNGTMRFLGGDVTGIPLLSNIVLELGAGFSSAFQTTLRGSSVLSGDLATGQTLDLTGDNAYGTATLNLSGPTRVDGEVHLTSVNGGYTVRLGTTDLDLDNGGTIRTSLGSGGLRFLRGDINNDGTIQIDHPTTLEDGPILNQGDIHIASGQSLKFDNGMIFEQNAGGLHIDGSFEIANGTSNLNGGVVLGMPLFSNGTMNLGAGFTTALEANLRGTVTLNGDIESGQLLRLRGDNAYGTGSLNLPSALTVRGEIELNSENGGYTANLVAALGSEPTIEGTVRTVPGSGGARNLSFQLENNGLVDVQTATSLGRIGALHSNRGTLRAIAPLTLTGTSFTNMDGARVVSISSITNTSFAVQNDGTWDVGPGIGTGSLSGHWTQGTGGRFVVEIGGHLAGTEHDQLVIGGTATLGGRVRIQAANGFQPQFGDQFVILTASTTQTLGFEGITYDGDLSPGHVFELVDTGSSIIVQVVRSVNGILPGEAPLTLSDPSPGIAGQVNTFQVSGASGGGQIVVVFGLALGSTPTGACAGVDFGIDAATQVGTAIASPQGNALVSATIPAGAAGVTAYFQALDLTRCELSEVGSFLFP